MSTLPSETTSATEPADVAQSPASGEHAPHAATAADVVTPPHGAARRGSNMYVIALAALGVLVIAALALPRRQAPGDRGAAGRETQAQEQSIDVDSAAQPITAGHTSAAPSKSTAAQVAHSVATPRALGQPPKKTAAKPAKSLTAAPIAPVSAPAAVVEARDAKSSTANPALAEPIGTAPASAPSAAETAGIAPVTITGCLEMSTDEDRIRLTDTDGASAPKSRSWRTGFLKRRSAPVDLVGASDTQALQKQVGKRVAATGVLTSRELRVSSFHVVSPACD